MFKHRQASSWFRVSPLQSDKKKLSQLDVKIFFLVYRKANKNNFTFLFSLSFCTMERKCPDALSDWCCSKREVRGFVIYIEPFGCVSLTAHILAAAGSGRVLCGCAQRAVPLQGRVRTDTRCPPGKEVPRVAPLCDCIP